MIRFVSVVFLIGNYVGQHCCVGQLWNIIVCTNFLDFIDEKISA